MAAIARSPECPLVNVVSPVAIVAIGRERDLADVLGRMTAVALKSLVRARQRVPRLRPMIETPARPTVRVVAHAAIRPQATLVVAVPMAVRAQARRILE